MRRINSIIERYDIGWPEAIGTICLVLGVLGGFFPIFFSYAPIPWLERYHSNVSIVLVAIGSSVLIVERGKKARARREEKKRLIQQMGSRENTISVEAGRKLESWERPLDDHYTLLGVTSSISQEELRKRYEYLRLTLHPDRFTDQRSKELAEQAMKNIEEAYEVLSDPVMRPLYDYNQKLARVWTPATWPESLRSKPPAQQLKSPGPQHPGPAEPEPAGPLPYQGPPHARVVMWMIGSILIILALAWFFGQEKRTTSQNPATSMPARARLETAVQRQFAPPGGQQTLPSSVITTQAVYRTTIGASNWLGSRMAQESCKSWSKVTLADEGKILCVYGVIRDTYYAAGTYYMDTGEKKTYYLRPRYYIVFSKDEKSFRFADFVNTYPDLKAGDCVTGIGEVKVDLDMPYIELTRQLDSCN